MKILYSLPHPADTLDSGQAGHTVRARALLAALETLGQEVVRVQAAANQQSQATVNIYRQLVKKLLPRRLAMYLRDNGRVAYSRRYAVRLTEAVRQHQPNVIFETHIAFSLAGKLASEATGVPLALDDVTPWWEEEQQYGAGARGLARSTHREVTQHASLLVATTGAIRRLLSEEGIPGDKIVTIPNGISDDMLRLDGDGATQRAALGIAPDAVVIGFVGSFQPYHRVDWLLDAFAQISPALNAHLLLVGDGQRAPQAKAHAEQRGLTPRVTFTGRVPYEDVPAYVAAADIAILPATNSYGNPMKVYEYMALGNAVIAPNCGTLTEIVTHDESALLFEPENIDAMAQAMTQLVTDHELRARVGRQAQQRAHAHTWLKRGERLQHAMQLIVGMKV